MIKYIISILLIYLIVGFFLFFLQRKILFNICGKPKKPQEYGLNDIEEVSITAHDGQKLLAWYSPPKPNNPVLIYFHGNSFDIGERAFRIKKYIEMGWGVCLLAWRGYSGNSGKPTEKNLYIDGDSAIQWVQDKSKYNLDNIIIYGESLGTGVAVQMATIYKFKSIILEAPFTSITDIAKKKYFMYPVKYLILDHFNNFSKIDKLLSPVLIISGKKDEIVPHEHSVRLFSKANTPKHHLFIDEAMHNDLYDFGIEKEVNKFAIKVWK
tara:strand:+ start:1088 stop:1888 length:801 start_codon:yes stop_codon:yes gene_type:complete